ncbi:hypothetical protein B7C42_07276 [Nocardia cerradoensis]|jgi:hypothetical protein|uniref:Uncharacterized protein n=1 Tax=Nocardia cerradoensis TaxID=85688 RepID=A0A231GVT3_9NOCA|nr:hypothetical protein B7C42_07276 [Nocardia cerradoensis]
MWSGLPATAMTESRWITGVPQNSECLESRFRA